MLILPVIVIVPFAQLALVHFAPLFVTAAHVLKDLRERINDNDRNDEQDGCETFGHDTNR